MSSICHRSARDQPLCAYSPIPPTTLFALPPHHAPPASSSPHNFVPSNTVSRTASRFLYIHFSPYCHYYSLIDLPAFLACPPGTASSSRHASIPPTPSPSCMFLILFGLSTLLTTCQYASPTNVLSRVCPPSSCLQFDLLIYLSFVTAFANYGLLCYPAMHLILSI